MKTFTKKYQGYELTYYIKPGEWMQDDELAALKKELHYVNDISNKVQLSYGILADGLTKQEIRAQFSKKILCVMKDGAEPIGFFYNSIVQESAPVVIHFGLVIVAKNRGIDLIFYPRTLMSLIQYKMFGEHFITTVTAIPSVIGNFIRIADDVWPNPYSCQRKPKDKIYYKVVELLMEKYMKPLFIHEEVTYDLKRFVMTTPTQTNQFELNPRMLAKHEDLIVNLFCFSWMDPERGEDIIAVGRYNLKYYLRMKIFSKFIESKGLVNKAISWAT